MKTNRYIAVLLVLIILLAPLSAFAKPAYSAKAYALMEASTGRLLLSYNEHEQLPMASTTKIMTCVVALENSSPDETVEISKNAAGIEGSSMYLHAGERLTMHELLLGLMLKSGNDAAYAIAEHIGGSIENFAAMMNKKACEIGAVDTHFVTPNGLHDEAHYTTAYDLALISSYAMQNESFRALVSTRSHHIEETDVHKEHWLSSKNRILWEYEGGNGVKTGYTKKAGKCLSSSAERDGMQLIAVVLNDGDMFEDCKALLDYGFANYKMQKVLSGGEAFGEIRVEGGAMGSVCISAAEDILLPLSGEEYNIIERNVFAAECIKAPVAKGDIVGRVDILLCGEVIASSLLTADSDIEENSYRYNLGRLLYNWLFSAA